MQVHADHSGGHGILGSDAPATQLLALGSLGIPGSVALSKPKVGDVDVRHNAWVGQGLLKQDVCPLQVHHFCKSVAHTWQRLHDILGDQQQADD